MSDFSRFGGFNQFASASHGFPRESCYPCARCKVFGQILCAILAAQFVFKTTEGTNLDRHTNLWRRIQLKLFSYQSIFFFFGGCPKFPFFDNLAKKACTQKHNKNRGFSKALFEEVICVTKQPFSDRQKTRSEIPVIIFLASFFSFNNKSTKIGRNPTFIVF